MKYNYREIACGALAFYNTAKSYIESPFRSYGTQAIPCYVNLAFSCELFMKAIIVFNNSDITPQELKKLGHNLDTLFEALPNEIRSEIRVSIPDCMIESMKKKRTETYKQSLHTDISLQAKYMIESRINNFPSTFSEILEQHADQFEKWRYFYEAVDGTPISCELEFLFPFATALRDIMARIMGSTSALNG